MASRKNEKKNLSVRHEDFCREYVLNGEKGAAAALAAGMPKGRTKQTAYELLQRPEIQERISEIRSTVLACKEDAMREAAARTEITVTRVMEEYARLAFFDIRRFFNADGTLKPVVELDDSDAAAISGLDVDSGKVSKIKLSDKKAALDSISKILGLSSETFAEKPVQQAETPEARIEFARKVAFLLRRGQEEQNSSEDGE